jgi:type VI secretion system ImpM family protein
LKHAAEWKWFVWGKHPGVEDFISAGSPTPLFLQFTRWVDNGFARIGGDNELKTRYCSWRFWTRGTGEHIVCGLVRNSCDCYGRSFPLLYLGSGELKGWMRNCSLLPFAFEPVWKNFEYAGSARHHSVQRLDETLQVMQAPGATWHRFRLRIFNEPNLYSAASFDEEISGTNRLVKIECKCAENLPHDMNFCNLVMPRGSQHPPKAVFIGEIGRRIAVAIVDAVLTPADFHWLWSLREDRHTKTSSD